jgi:hypothetical protein
VKDQNSHFTRIFFTLITFRHEVSFLITSSAEITIEKVSSFFSIQIDSRRDQSLIYLYQKIGLWFIGKFPVLKVLNTLNHVSLILSRMRFGRVNSIGFPVALSLILRVVLSTSGILNRILTAKTSIVTLLKYRMPEEYCTPQRQ